MSSSVPDVPQNQYLQHLNEILWEKNLVQRLCYLWFYTILSVRALEIVSGSL